MSGGGRLLSSRLKGVTLAEGATHVVISNSLNKYAFTLAEVLVTLGIIGVISAMTVPSLMQNYQRQSYLTQLHKFYNELSQALVQYQTDKNALSLKEAGLTSQENLNAFFKNYFKIVNDCGTTQTPCLAPASEYKNIAGRAIGTGCSSYMTIASGASFGSLYSGGTVVFTLYLDINGQKGPNIAGRDIFAIYIYNNGLIDDSAGENGAPMTFEERENTFNNNCIQTTGTTWYGCFGKILNDNWQMTY